MVLVITFPTTCTVHDVFTETSHCVLNTFVTVSRLAGQRWVGWGIIINGRENPNPNKPGPAGGSVGPHPELPSMEQCSSQAITNGQFLVQGARSFV